MLGVGETKNFFNMEVRQEIKDAYRMAKELAVMLKKKKGISEASSRIVTIYDEQDEPWAEIRVVFNDAVPAMLKVHIGGTNAQKEWKDDEWGLEQMEDVLSEIQNFIPVRLNWLGE